MKTKKENKCDAKYGDKRCENLASAIVVSGGNLFFLCKSCAKIEKKQKKVNNNF